MKDFKQVRVLENGCWEWQGVRDRKRGYGHVNFAGMQFGAHRLFYILFNGRLDPNLQVCHTCDNPPCVNPEHLFCGTSKENQQDCKRKGRLGARGRNATKWKYGELSELLNLAIAKFKMQTKIAEALGVTRQAVSSWFLGKSKPGKGIKEKLISIVTQNSKS